MSSTHMHYRRAPKPPCQPSKLGSSNSIEPPSFLNASGISDRRVGSDESRSTSFSNLSSLPGTWHPAVPTVCETLVLACVLDDELLNTLLRGATTLTFMPYICAHSCADISAWASAGAQDNWTVGYGLPTHVLMRHSLISSC